MPTQRSSAFARWMRAARDAIRAFPHPDRRERMIAYGLDAAYERAGDPEPFDVGDGKIIIFSDHHRGARDGADDFLRCERAYRAALGHYLEAGHTLLLLGDVEELWECRLPAPLQKYAAVLDLERAFAARSRLRRFYGNHDLVWSGANVVERYLARAMDTEVEVQESLRLEVRDGDRRLGEIFLTHGHQGTPDSDLWAPLAMIPVRYVWPALQRSVKFASTSPAIDFNLRAGHDLAMFRWAQARSAARRPLVLITGHTHKPVFRQRKASGDLPGGVTVPSRDEARAQLETARAAGAPPDELAKLRAMLEFVLTDDYGAPPVTIEPPCYFNTGCCSFADGDVTGIEIAGGNISLVRWLDNDDEPRSFTLDSAPLEQILGEVAGAAPIATAAPAAAPPPVPQPT